MIMELMKDKLEVEVSYTLGAHNMAYPFVDRESGKTVHLIGFQGNIKGKHHLKWKGSALYAGALYAIRHPDRTYEVLEVNNAYKDGKPTLVSPRTFCRSPFGDKGIFIGGHDASRKISDDMAWIFHATEEVALGRKRGRMRNLPSTIQNRLRAYSKARFTSCGSIMQTRVGSNT